MEYIERAAQLGLDSSVAVFVLMGDAPGDVEFLPLKPRQADETMLAELKTSWPGRGLDHIGVIGLCGTKPRLVLKKPISDEQASALANAFLAYLHSLFHDSFAAQIEAAEVAELVRIHSLPDMRGN